MTKKEYKQSIANLKAKLERAIEIAENYAFALDCGEAMREYEKDIQELNAMPE